MTAIRVRRLLAAVVITALAGSFVVAAPSAALACEEAQLHIAAVARGYDAGDSGRYLDGIVTNDTTQTVRAERVEIGWAQNARIGTEAWLCSEFLAPGQWTTFHMDWPDYVPTSWTPQPVGIAYADDSAGKLPLAVSDVSAPAADDNGNRAYTVTVDNPNAFSVSSLDIIGAEKDASSTEFVDALDYCEIPDSIAPGGSAQFTLTGYSPWDTPLTADVRVLGLEKPVLTLTPDTLAPAAGTPITFKITMTHEDGTPVTGERCVQLFYTKDSEEWCRSFDLKLRHSNSTTATVYTWKPTYFKAVYWGGDDLGWTESDVVFAQPTASTAVSPPSVPAKVRRKHVFVVRGRMGADPESAGAKVVVTAERKVGRRWKKAASLSAAPNQDGRFSAPLKLSSTGTYRIRSYRSGLGYTGYRTLKVVK